MGSLEGKGRFEEPAPTEKGLSVGGVVKMGPRMREDNGRGMGGCRADACLNLGMGVESQR